MKRLLLEPVIPCTSALLRIGGKVCGNSTFCGVLCMNANCYTSNSSNREEDFELSFHANAFAESENKERKKDTSQRESYHSNDMHSVRECFRNRDRPHRFNKSNIDNNIERESQEKHKQHHHHHHLRQPYQNSYKLRKQDQKNNVNMNTWTHVQVPKSLDINEVESRLDVEKYFPSTIAHLKSPPESSYVADNEDERRWSEATHEYDASGVRIKPSANSEDVMEKEHSFFDQGSLDIRGGLHDAMRQRQPTRLGARVGLPRTREEQLSPDILQLTGGSLKRDGALRLTAQSNDAPADATTEAIKDEFAMLEGSNKNANSANSEFGDTPEELTDMLRERLMELKRDKLHEERHETYMPRRLNLLRDAEIDAKMLTTAHKHSMQEKEFNSSSNNNNSTLESLRHSEHHAKPEQTIEFDVQSKMGMKEGNSFSLHAQRASLADLASSSASSQHKPVQLKDIQPETEESYSGSTETRDNDERQLAIHRDGVSSTAARDALRLLSSASSYIPGEGGESNLNDLSSLEIHGYEQTTPDGNERAGGVHLLRVLPRTGFCSRREASAIVASGQVLVNRVVERNPFRVVYAEDDIHVSGHSTRLRFTAPRLWIYHKPANVLVSRNDPVGRRLMTRHARILGFDHLIPIGSLPFRAHGVLLLTNDGELASFLERPSAMVQQTYLMRVRPAIDAILAHKLNTEGVNINGKQYHNMEFIVNPSVKSRFSLKIKIRGEMMPISHLLQHLGRVIERGGRISFGPFALGGLAVGSIREVTVPPFFMQHVGHIWKPFIERDWPFFRRQRVARLRRLSRYRELSAKEVEELENFTFDELTETLSFESSEMASVAAKRAEEMRRRPVIHDEAIPTDFVPNTYCSDIDMQAAEFDANRSWIDEDPVIEDITTFAETP